MLITRYVLKACGGQAKGRTTTFLLVHLVLIWDIMLVSVLPDHLWYELK